MAKRLEDVERSENGRSELGEQSASPSGALVPAPPDDAELLIPIPTPLKVTTPYDGLQFCSSFERAGRRSSQCDEPPDQTEPESPGEVAPSPAAEEAELESEISSGEARPEERRDSTVPSSAGSYSMISRRSSCRPGKGPGDYRIIVKKRRKPS